MKCTLWVKKDHTGEDPYLVLCPGLTKHFHAESINLTLQQPDGAEFTVTYLWNGIWESFTKRPQRRWRFPRRRQSSVLTVITDREEIVQETLPPGAAILVNIIIEDRPSVMVRHHGWEGAYWDYLTVDPANPIKPLYHPR